MSSGEKKNQDGVSGETPQPSETPKAEMHEEHGPGHAAPDPDALKKDLDTALGEVERIRDKWLRAEAELDNYRKRVQKEKYEHFLYGHEKIVREILPVLDNLGRAIEHASEMGLDQKILEGVELTHKQFLAVLEKYGVVPVTAIGKEFDPNMHEAVMEEESQEFKPRTIIKEVEKGYMLRDRLLRPSKVVLAKAKPPNDEQKTHGEDTTGGKEVNGGR